MRRVMVLLVAGTVLSGLAAAYAASGRWGGEAQAREVGVKRDA
jgi:hypothetical protein